MDEDHGELVHLVGGGYEPAREIARALGNEELRELLARGLTGYRMWARLTEGGLLDPFTGKVR